VDVRTNSIEDERPMFVSTLFEPISDHKELADYVTKNLMKSEVRNSGECELGLYELGRNRMRKLF